jgi:dipeptidyl aminopeptidase/acylaminoacyl peptidase
MYFSPADKYLVLIDKVHGAWFSHNIALNTTKNISGTLRQPLYYENDFPDFPRSYAIAGWLVNDKAVLIYDRYDIWQVDPEGIIPPINITHGFGKRYNIRFRYVDFHAGEDKAIGANDTLLLSAFDMSSKMDGFYHLTVNGKSLQKLIMSAHIYNYITDDFCGVHYPVRIAKAKNTNTYMLFRMSATEYPNMFLSRNLIDLIPVTNLAPQKNYNWYTTELVHWKLPDGKPAEGILFKPENFNPAVKYPVIFYYYEKNAYNLNAYIYPELSFGNMNITWYVSNGYLVFVPDIYYTVGYPGKSGYNSVESAALYLSKKPWVDPQRLGLQGHSYAGFETNYIVSHSTLFKAASPASGMSDFVSIYGEVYDPWYYEDRQGRIGAAPWQRPDLYIENSPIFKADKVTAAILIMHTVTDWGVPYLQGLEWYNSLLRLHKKVWLLSYKNDNHILSDDQNRLDYSIRLAQFFDHFLKNGPEPGWMAGDFYYGSKGLWSY